MSLPCPCHRPAPSCCLQAQQPDVDLDRVLAVHGAVHQHGLDQAEARDGDGLTVRRGRGHLVALLTIVKIVR